MSEATATQRAEAQDWEALEVLSDILSTLDGEEVGPQTSVRILQWAKQYIVERDKAREAFVALTLSCVADDALVKEEAPAPARKSCSKHGDYIPSDDCPGCYAEITL